MASMYETRHWRQNVRLRTGPLAAQPRIAQFDLWEPKIPKGDTICDRGASAD